MGVITPALEIWDFSEYRHPVPPAVSQICLQLPPSMKSHLFVCLVIPQSWRTAP